MSGAREQVTRMLALVPYLQHNQGVPLRKVADDFGVRPDQIVKDLKVLWYCGLPGLGPGELIDFNMESFEDDPDGQVRISNADFLTRPLRLGSSEAAALIVALRALREGSPEDSRTVIDRVLVKLEDASADATPTVSAHVVRTRPDDTATRVLLGQAVVEDRQVRLEYYVPARDETTERVVDPLAVLDRDGNAYLDAWCHLAQGRRTFRLDRIDAAEVLDQKRAHPDEAARDLGEELFQAAPDDLTAVLRLRPGARWLADYYPIERAEEAPGGALDVTLRVADERWLIQLVLEMAPDVLVLEPASYATEIAVRAGQTLRLYDDGVA